MGEGYADWLDGELAACNLADERLTKRLRKLLGQIGGAMGQSIPFACQDWPNVKGAYRFLSNDRVNEADSVLEHRVELRAAIPPFRPANALVGIDG